MGGFLWARYPYNLEPLYFYIALRLLTMGFRERLFLFLIMQREFGIVLPNNQCQHRTLHIHHAVCEDRILDGPASGGKGSKGGPYHYLFAFTQFVEASGPCTGVPLSSENAPPLGLAYGPRV